MQWNLLVAAAAVEIKWIEDKTVQRYKFVIKSSYILPGDR